MGIITSRAIAAWDVSQYSGSGSLLDITGNGHDMAFPGGTNNPTFYACPQQFIRIPGIAGNTVSTPHADIGTLVGNVTIEGEYTLGDYTPAATQVLFDKLSGNSGIKLELTTATNVLTLTVGDGAATEALASTAATGLTDATRHTITAEWIDATSVIFRLDGTKLGGTVVGSKTLADSGGAATVGVLTGGFHRITVTKAAAVVANLIVKEWANAASTHTDSAGNVWTVNTSGTASVARIVQRAHLWFDTDDYLTTPDHANLDFAAGDPLTAVFAGRLFTSTLTMALINKGAVMGGSPGWALYQYFTEPQIIAQIADGAVNTPFDSKIATRKVAQVFGLVRSVAADTVTSYVDGVGSGSSTTDTTTGTLANASVLTIGTAQTVPTYFFQGEFYGAAIFREALSATEVAALQSEMLTGSGGSMMLLGVG